MNKQIKQVERLLKDIQLNHGLTLNEIAELVLEDMKSKEAEILIESLETMQDMLKDGEFPKLNRGA